MADSSPSEVHDNENDLAAGQFSVWISEIEAALRGDGESEMHHAFLGHDVATGRRKVIEPDVRAVRVELTRRTQLR